LFAELITGPSRRSRERAGPCFCHRSSTTAPPTEAATNERASSDSFDIQRPQTADLRISAIFDELLTITRERVAACRLGVRNQLDWPVLGIILRTLYKLGKVWTNGSRALGQRAAILTEKSRANSAKSLSNVSCHEREKKCLTWQNSSNAEPSPGKDEPHLPARGKPILVKGLST
jgi:hypothetical protein